MNHAQVQLTSLPITLLLLENGQVVFQLHQKIAPILDTSPSGLSIVIDEKGILVGDVNLAYNTTHTLSEDVKGWLRSFNIINPFDSEE